MLRVQPVYGSKWEDGGSSTLGSCTVVEYAGVRVLVNVGGPVLDDTTSSSSVLSDGVNMTGMIGGVVAGGEGPTSTTIAPSKVSKMPPLPDHDCVLLTDSTLENMGNLPLYCKQQKELLKKQRDELRQLHDDPQQMPKLKPKPIYATFPTVKMGQMALYDYHANLSLDGGCPPFTLEDMDYAFSQLQTIKYAQTINLPLDDDTDGDGTDAYGIKQRRGKKKPKLLAITAYRAGHVVGGAFYVMQRIQDETVVVITSTYHIAKEMHLDSSTLLKYGATPDVLVTYPGGPAMKWLSQLYNTPSLATQQGGTTGGGSGSAIVKKKETNKLKTLLVTQAERNITEHVMSVLRRDGNVLLPVDASGRVLELVLLLSQHWQKNRLQGTYNLIWLGPMVPNTLEFTKSQLEWMADALGNQFDSPSSGGGGGGGKDSKGGGGGLVGGGHPYALRGVERCTSVDQVQAIMNDNKNPTCVLATGLSLDHGPARDMLLQWADNDNHSILFTDSSHCHVRPWVQKLRASLQKQQQADVANAVAATVDAAVAPTGDGLVPTSALQKKIANVVTPAAATGAVVGGGVVAAAAATIDEADPTATGADDHADLMAGEAIGNVLDVSEYTTSYQLLYHWCKAQWEDREMDDSVTVDVLVPHRSTLKGAALKQFLEQEEAARVSKRKLEQERAMLREVELAKGRLRLGEAEGAGGGTSTATGTASSTGTSTSMTDGANTSGTALTKGSSRPKKKNRFDQSLFLKFSKPLHLTFEVREEAVGVGQVDSTAKFGIGESVGHQGEVLEDDYGIAVIPDHFVDIVTGVDPSKFAGGSGRIGEEVLRRGLGFGVVGDAVTTGGGKAKNKKRGANADEDEDGEDDFDEQGYEAVDLSEGRGIIRGRNGRPPTRVCTVPRKLQVFAEIAYIPLEGRVDSRAARQSVRALQPRQVVVLGGPAPEVASPRDEMDTTDGVKKEEMGVVDEVSLLAEAAQSFLTTNNKVPTPSDKDMVELEVGHAAYSVRLIDTPYRTKDEKEKEEEPPAPIELYEAKLGACAVSLLDFVATGQKVALDGSIVLAPRAKSNSKQPSIYVSDGEVLLTDLRSELIAQGMKAEYTVKAGYSQLVVNGTIIVKKDQDSGRINVEGPLCEDFFTVRSVVCGQYVTL